MEFASVPIESREGEVAPGRDEAHNNRGLGNLFKTLAEETQALTRAEAQLIRTEVGEKVNEAEKGIASMATGLVALNSGVLILLFAAVFGLALIMPLWGAALLVGAVMTVIAAAMVLAGKKKVEPEHLEPERSIHEVKETKQFAKEQLAR